MKGLLMGVVVLALSACASSPDPVPGRLENPAGFVALTFDDGPFDHSDRLLRILAEHEVRATFFVIGRHVQARPDQARRIFDAGHDLANHSWSHASLGNPSPGPDAIRRELGDTSRAIRGITGEDPVFFRAPNLNYGSDLAQVAREMGMAIIGSDAIGRDWEDISPARIVGNVLDAARDGSIVLLHEQFGGDNLRTEKAVPEIIRGLRARGLEVVSLSELVQIRGARLTAGTLYNAIN
ncbi:MAG: polysaccharide deacetylase family protein [Treponema sp.]|nr:polysaccharide deacetylase family protein [Treponema sp.]